MRTLTKERPVPIGEMKMPLAGGSKTGLENSLNYEDLAFPTAKTMLNKTMDL